MNLKDLRGLDDVARWLCGNVEWNDCGSEDMACAARDLIRDASTRLATLEAALREARDAARAEADRLRAALRDARMFVDGLTAARIDTALKGGDDG